MGKLAYLALCFLIAFIFIGQLPTAAADVRKHKSQGEEIEASGRNNGEAGGASNGLTTQKKFVTNDVLWATAKFRKILKEPEYNCEPETITCTIYPSIPSECGGSTYCKCFNNIEIPICKDSRFYS